MPVDLETYKQHSAPKTDQLNAEDLLTGPITVTVEGVENGNKEQAVFVAIGEGRQPFKPCKTVQKLLHFAWDTGGDPNQWVGKSLTLYHDPEVKNRGEVVGGIRVSHVSHIREPMTCKLTETRGKRYPITVYPLPDSKPKQPSVADRVAKAIKAYESCEDQALFEKYGSRIDELFSLCDEDQKAAIMKAHGDAAGRLN